jgi:uncharacterized protein (TIGR00730 family)
MSMSSIRSLCLYCGSRPGNRPVFADAAEAFGALCARRGIRLVYGGGSIGLMGVAARACLAAGGQVLGIIPHHLDHVEITMQGLSELRVVTSMHERKNQMFIESDGFVVLPGGIGTLDEFIEMTTWAQLGLHAKPVLLVNVEGYWNPFLALMAHIVDTGFAAPATTGLYNVVDGVADVLPALERLAGKGAETRSLLF